MMRSLLIFAVVICSIAVAQGQYYVAGDFNGWNPSGALMTDLGNGIWQATVPAAAGRHEFKVTTGDWSSNWPAANSWLYTDASGAVTVTFDTNVHTDNWHGSADRIGVSVNPTTWTAVGDWQGWDNANPATKMRPLGNGIYRYVTSSIGAGTYSYKAVVTGTWDAIGDDSRSVNAASTQFVVPTITDYPNTAVVVFDVNPATGVEYVSARLSRFYNPATDYNFDLLCNFKDYIILEQNFGKSGMTDNSCGDATGDGWVNYKDYIAMEQQFGYSAPEPMTLGLLAAGVPLLCRKRRG